MLARGALGNPWLFDALLSGASDEPTRVQIIGELHWTIERAVEHLGEPRATRYLRKFYPWYIARLQLDAQSAKRLQAATQQSETLEEVRGTTCLVCPWHGSAFDLDDGEPRRGPAANRQDKLEVRMEAGHVLARLPSRHQ